MSETNIPDVNTSDVLEEKDENTVETQKPTISEKIAEMVQDVVEDAKELAGDVAEKVADVLDDVKDAVSDAVDDVKDKVNEDSIKNFADKSLSELVDLFGKIEEDVDRMKKSKEVEAIKSAFYKKLVKEKVEAGLVSPQDEQTESYDEEAAADSENAEAAPADGAQLNPFQAIEAAFKSKYAQYKKERAEYNKEQEKEREDNLAAKEAVIEDLKALVEKQEDVNATFPAFREIQARWRAIGPVPAQKFRDVNDTYQFYVEKFYDMVKINRDLRDLDFKKNLEAKEAFCVAAEKLSENENVVSAFHELQKLHEQWKEFGPVAKEYRDQIWDRFKAATAVINKKYQAHFEGLKEKQEENLAAKTVLCEKVEEIADKEVASSTEWNALSKEIEGIQAEWKKIGFASKKENQKIYDRFRAACDKFFEKKRDFYSQYKDSMNDNLNKKIALVEAAEALKSSTEWKKATDEFINLQKKWKEIGAVPRKKSEQLWKRFRGACDEFFAERDKQAKPENDFYGNLKAKKKLVEDINAYVPADAAADEAAMKDFSEKWQAIGFVPFKEKEAITQAYKDAMNAKFPELFGRGMRRGGRQQAKAPRSEKEILIQKYNALQQDIDTYENNIGFFAMSKNAEKLLEQMQQKISAAKQELKELEEKIRSVESEENNG